MDDVSRKRTIVPRMNMAAMAHNMGLLRPFMLRRRNSTSVAIVYSTTEIPEKLLSPILIRSVPKLTIQHTLDKDGDKTHSIDLYHRGEGVCWVS